MEELLNKIEKRSLLFLRVLYGEERWWSQQELSTLANCSANATYYTLNLLKAESLQQSGGFRILSKKSKGYFLEAAHDQLSLGEIECLFIQQTLSFKIIDSIFQFPPTSIDDLADILFFSKSTIYRQSRELAIYFEKNGLLFNTHSFVLSGPESLMREFFYRFYWFFIKSKKWPFKLISYDEVLSYYMKKSNAQLSFNRLERIQFFYRYAINHTRHQHNAFVTEEIDWTELDPKMYFYIDLLRPFVGSDVSHKYQENECRFLTLALLSSNFFQNYNDDFEEKVKWYKTQNTLSYKFSTSTVQLFRKLNPTHNVEDDIILTYKLICLHIKMSFFSELIIRHTNIMTFLDTLSQENLLFFEQLQQILSKSSRYLKKVPNDDNSDYLLYYVLLIFTLGVDLDDLESDVFIKLVCTAEPLSQGYLKDKLLKHIDHTVVVHINQPEVNTDHQYDLILSDVQLQSLDKQLQLLDDEPGTQFYSWDFPPTERDWKNIYNILNSFK